MNRTILFIALTLGLLEAQSYEALLQEALESNTALKLSQTQEEEEQLKGVIATRLENPTLELEVADFSAKRLLRENEVGARVGLSQSLLLPSVKRDQEHLSTRRVEVAKERFRLDRSTFIYRFNRGYLSYKEAFKKEQLAGEILAISEKILSVVEARFRAGSIAKSELLQAQIEAKEEASRVKHLRLERVKAKHDLLLFANLKTDENPSTEHSFMLEASSSEHPLLMLNRKKEEEAEAALALASHTVESIEFFSEIEAEPDQDIFRVGLAVALPTFNQKSEEKQLAKIAINNQKILLASQERALVLELKTLKHEIAEEEGLKREYQVLITEQEQLLVMYQEGYAIAKVNLLKLNSLKKSLLGTKEQLLSSALTIEQKIIKINYLQGAYSE